MAFPVGYLRPGVYDQLVNTPNGVNIIDQGFTPVWIACGSRVKTVRAEGVVRAAVMNETLTVADTAIALEGVAQNQAVWHAATLARRATRRPDHTRIHRVLNGAVTVVPDQYIRYGTAQYTGARTGDTSSLSFAGSAVRAFGLELDGQRPVTVALSHNATPGVTISGRTISVAYTFTTPATPSLAQVADAINTGLTFADATALGFGPSYVGTVSAVGNQLVVTSSADTAPSGDIRIWPAAANDATAALFGTAATLDAPLGAGSILYVNDTFWVPNARWLADYVQRDDDASDELSRPNVTKILKVGRQSNASSFTQGQDFVLTAATLDVDGEPLPRQIDWTPDEPAILRGTTSTTVSSVGAGAGIRLKANEVSSTAVRVALAAPTVTTVRITTAAVGDYTVTVNGTITTYTASGSPTATAIRDALMAALDALTAHDALTFAASGTDAFTITAPAETALVVTAVTSNLTATTVATRPRTEVVTAVNTALATALGPDYANVAAVDADTGEFTLTAPIRGRSGRSTSIVVTAETAAERAAIQGLFGGDGSATQLNVRGRGSRPLNGQVYYVTYQYPRPDGSTVDALGQTIPSEYERPFFWTDAGDAVASVGQASAAVVNGNPLAIATQIGVEHKLKHWYTIQIDDRTTPGQPTAVEVARAIDAARKIRGITEVVVVGQPGTTLSTWSDELAYLEDENAVTEKHYTRAFMGMAAGTSFGSRDEEDTFIYAATNTLQVPPDSVARGRMFLAAPPSRKGIPKVIEYEDGTSTLMWLDSTYVAVALAAQRCVLPNPSETLLGDASSRWAIEAITDPWKPGEVDLMLAAGVAVLSLEGGRLVWVDPCSTERGVGGDIRFEQDSITYQHDACVRAVIQAVHNNHTGAVPYSPEIFMRGLRTTIKSAVEQQVTDGVIGPFTDQTTGAVREMDLDADIQVRRHPTNKRAYLYGWWFNGKYPAALFFGEHSIDRPFWSAQ